MIDGAAVRLELTLAALEAVTAELGAVAPDEFERWGTLLARRQQALAPLPELLAEAGPGERGRLEAIWQAGAALEERVAVARAAARHGLRQAYRAQFHLRALGAALPAEFSTVEVLG